MAAEDAPARPEPAPEWEWVWRAWHRLHRDRAWLPSGMGGAVPRGISAQALAELAAQEGLSADEAELLALLVAPMDGVFFDHQEAVSQKAAEAAKRR